MDVQRIKIAIRSVFRQPGFAATAIALIALGAGGNAVVFSIVHGVLLSPLPYSQPERLVAVWPGQTVSNRDLDYFRDSVSSFEQVAAISPGWMMGLVAEGGEPLKVTGGRVTDNIFATLGVRAAVGRAIEAGDGPQRVVVLAHSLWQSRFNGAGDVLGRPIDIDGQTHRVIGVMPPGFEIFTPGTDIWVPYPNQPGMSGYAALVLARLRADVGIDEASKEIQTVAGAMRRDLSYPDDWGRTLSVVSLQESVVGPFRRTLMILFGAAALILLIAAVNLGTIALGRSVARAQEVSVRLALGASRRDLFFDALVEHAIVAAIGGLAGLAVARAMLPLVILRIPPEIPRIGTIGFDGAVFGFVLASSMGVALLMGLIPVCLATRPSAQVLLRETRSTETRERRRSLSTLVIAQVMLAVVLGVGAGLMLRSLWNLQRVHPGFVPEGVLTFRLQTTSKFRTLDSGLPYFEQVVERIRALPGVISVGSIQHLPMTGYTWSVPTEVEGQPLAGGVSPPEVNWRFIGWDYFAAMGMPLLRGRTFDAADTRRAPQVAVVSESVARKFFGEPESALGALLMLTAAGQRARVEIVGVVGDVRHKRLDRAAEPELYRPLAQTFMFPMAFVVRTAGPPAQWAPAIRQIAYAIDPTIPVAELQPLTTLLSNSLGRPRLLALLLSVFAGIGLLLSATGMYGVVAHRVNQRQREIGVRVALGAAPSSVAALVVRQAITLSVIGVSTGVPLALVLAGIMQNVVFGIMPRDPLTFVALPALVLAASLAASYLPARRAARIDPALTMKD